LGIQPSNLLIRKLDDLELRLGIIGQAVQILTIKKNPIPCEGWGLRLSKPASPAASRALKINQV